MGSPKWKGDPKKPLPYGRGLPSGTRLKKTLSRASLSRTGENDAFQSSSNQHEPVRQLLMRKSLGYRTTVSIHWLIMHCSAHWVIKCPGDNTTLSRTGETTTLSRTGENTILFRTGETRTRWVSRWCQMPGRETLWCFHFCYDPMT